jgi:flavin-binding protein dodecin
MLSRTVTTTAAGTSTWLIQFVRGELACGLDGRHGDSQCGLAQLGAGSAGGRRVIDVAHDAVPRASALTSCNSGFHPIATAAEVVEQDIHLDEGGAITYRTKLQLSFKYEREP